MKEQSKVNPENYIVVQGWMITDLHLKGNELLIYACIYGFSQTDEHSFSGGLQYLADWTNSTKQGVRNALKSLVEKGYIIRECNTIHGVNFVYYRSTKLTGVVNKVDWGGKQSLPNNINNNINNNIVLMSKSDEEIVRLFNSICTGLPHVRDLTDKRKKAIRSIAQTVESNGGWEKLFTAVQHSDFLTGRNGAWSGCGFDWILKPANVTKIMEGNYRNKDEASDQPPASYDIGQFEHQLIHGEIKYERKEV